MSRFSVNNDLSFSHKLCTTFISVYGFWFWHYFSSLKVSVLVHCNWKKKTTWEKAIHVWNFTRGSK